jgi:hypothetical protein
VVEHRIESPEAIPYVEVPDVVEPRQGPCLVCGAWVEDGLEVILRSREGSLVHAAHRACLESVARSDAALP